MKRDTLRSAGVENECAPAPIRRVLLVDNDAALRGVLDGRLQQWSFATTTAATFREARRVGVTEAPFTVIVSDYHLPDSDGLGFLDWLKREMLIDVPFLLLSAGVTRTPSAAEDYEFLAKPFRLQEFRNCLEKLCRVKPPTGSAFQLTVAQEALRSVYARSKPLEERGTGEC